MGIPYLTTLLCQYLKLISPPEEVSLKGKPIIVDGYSTMYSIYDQVVTDDKKRIKKEKVTKTPFGYEKYGDLLREEFSKFRNKCERVTVVFDGVYRRHKHRRSDPDRMSSLRCAALNQHGTQLPSLFERKFKSVLRELDIEIIVARGEADPMIAALAQERDAYVVAGDSDYHLYDLEQGYVPLRTLSKRMRGSLYRMKDVFELSDPYAVPLWATLIGYDFVSWEDLQKLFVNFEPHDAQEFHEWLEGTDPDNEKRLRIRTQFYLLRLIQCVGGESVHDAVIQFVPEAQRTEFNQVRSSYRCITVVQTIRTRGQKELPSYIDGLFVHGNLHRAIINLFINRKLLLFTESDDPVYLRFLLPIIQLIIKWDRPDVAPENCSSILYNGEKCNPVASIDEEALPSADEMKTMSREKKREWLLSCVKSALGSHMIVGTDRIRDDQLVWICLLKLWHHSQHEQSPTKDLVLRAMIVSYLNRKLLEAADPPGENFFQCAKICASTEYLECSSSKTTSQPVSKFVKRLKKEVSSEDCNAMNKAITKAMPVGDDNEEIKKDLEGFECFYQLFDIANQFFDLPLLIADPTEYGIEEAYYLAISMAQWKDPDRKISIQLFQSNACLTEIFNKTQEMIKQGPLLSTNTQGKTADNQEDS